MFLLMLADRLVSKAIKGSYFSVLPNAILKRLLAEAVRLDVPAGSTVYRESDDPKVGLVVTGLFRVYMTSPEGRQVTVGYARGGDVLGTAVVVGGPVAVRVQALIDSAILILNPQAVQELGKIDARVAWAIAEEVTRRLYAAIAEIAGNTFGTVRQRVVRHLLDLAAQRQEGQSLVAPVSQQDLANAVGSVREVVARVLHDLRREKLVDTEVDSIVLLDPGRLSAEAWTRDIM
jgi:CRP/FNR family transcriptional regulator, cyclic AMP receptor protein